MKEAQSYPDVTTFSGSSMTSSIFNGSCWVHIMSYDLFPISSCLMLPREPEIQWALQQVNLKLKIWKEVGLHIFMWINPFIPKKDLFDVHMMPAGEKRS
jgi:hypothetical protein